MLNPSIRHSCKSRNLVNNSLITSNIHLATYLLFFSSLSFISITVAQPQLDNSPSISLEKGIDLYDKGEYKKSMQIFEQLVTQDPENSDYYHWLGKSYGRIAENAPWLTAMSMAKKTRKAFEKSVELDEGNILALKDLMQYYLDAPGFLGGSKKKAKEIQISLDKIEK